MSRRSIRCISAEEVKQCVPMNRAIAQMRDAFMQLSSQRAVVPSRINMHMPDARANSLVMPVYLPDNKQYSVKVVSLFQDNPRRGLPFIHALMVLLDATDGHPLALMDAEYLTALRTGAASGLATELCSRSDAETVVIIGAGAQGRTQLEAMCSVRKISTVHVFDVHGERSASFAEEMSKKLSIPVTVAESPSVVSTADIICTATTSNEPVFSHRDLKPGAHINAIGAYKPDMCEIPGETMRNAKVVVDHRPSSLSEAGDIIRAIAQGFITEGSLHAELGEIVSGQKSARESPEEITVFKSVGNAVQDLAVASHVFQRAREKNIGIEVSL